MKTILISTLLIASLKSYASVDLSTQVQKCKSTFSVIKSRNVEQLKALFPPFKYLKGVDISKIDVNKELGKMLDVRKKHIFKEHRDGMFDFKIIKSIVIDNPEESVYDQASENLERWGVNKQAYIHVGYKLYDKKLERKVNSGGAGCWFGFFADGNWYLLDTL